MKKTDRSMLWANSIRPFRLIETILLVLTTLLILTACAQDRIAYADGVYTAHAKEASGSGWRDCVEVTIENGVITKVNWDSIFKDDSIPIRKKQYSKSGLYGMLAAGAINEWYDQAVAAEQFVLANGPDALTVSEDGKTDAISGCTIYVDGFEELLRECLRQAQT